MRIIVITDLYPIKNDEKYTPKTIYNFVHEWKNLGHTVEVIKPNFILNSFIRKKPFYKNGIYGDVENINYFLPFLGNIQNKIKTDLNADVVIAHMPSGLICANKLGFNFVAGVHASDIEVLTKPIYKFYFKSELEKAYKNANKIACRSYVLRDKFLNLYPEYRSKTFVAPSGIGVGAVKKVWESKDKIKVLTCGRLIKRKNIDKVIKACDELKNVELTVIGDGDEWKSLRKISSKALFTGQIPHNEVLEKMKESDIFVLPSINETFGVVYLEAMASGCVTVCTKGDGIDGIIKDGENGFLTEVDKVKETLQKIMASSENNNILENAYNTVVMYNEKRMAENYINNVLK